MSRSLEMTEPLQIRPPETRVPPASLGKPPQAPAAFPRWKMEFEIPAAQLDERLLRRRGSFILGLDRPLAGYLSLMLVGEGAALDVPVRPRLTFGAAPAVTTPLQQPARLPASTPELLRRIDRDGPGRDRRQWGRGLRLLAPVN